VRRVTRNLVLAILAILVVLLALGAVPGLLKSGDPYYLTATPEGETSNRTAAVDGANLSERSYPYTTAALANATGDEPGRSGPYWRGPVGFKEAFTHSPFDEMNALRGQQPNATVGEVVRVARNGTLYRVAVTR